MSSTDPEQMIAEYLRELDIAAAALPADRRTELIDEITAHIAEARAQAGSQADAADRIAAALARLGSPADIVMAAEQDVTDVLPQYVPVSYSDQGSLTAQEIVAIVLLLIGGFLFGIGWIAGAVLLWLSPKWRVSDKLLGTLIWPGGLAATLIVIVGAGFIAVTGKSTSTVGCTSRVIINCTGVAHSAPFFMIIISILVILIGLAAPILVAIRLVRRARSGPANPTGLASA